MVFIKIQYISKLFTVIFSDSYFLRMSILSSGSNYVSIKPNSSNKKNGGNSQSVKAAFFMVYGGQAVSNRLINCFLSDWKSLVPGSP